MTRNNRMNFRLSRMVIDPYGALMINRSNRIMTVFYFYHFSKHKLSMINMASDANLVCFVTVTFDSTHYSSFYVFYIYNYNYYI